VKKRKRKRNPLMEQKFYEGIQHATNYYLHRFEELKKEPGIGPVTAEKIERIMFRRYEDEQKT